MESEQFNELVKIFSKKLDAIDKKLSEFKKKNNIQGKITKKYSCGINKPSVAYSEGIWFSPKKLPNEVKELYLKAYDEAKSELGV